MLAMQFLVPTNGVHHARLPGVGFHGDYILEAVEGYHTMFSIPHIQNMLNLRAEFLKNRRKKRCSDMTFNNCSKKYIIHKHTKF